MPVNKTRTIRGDQVTDHIERFNESGETALPSAISVMTQMAKGWLKSGVTISFVHYNGWSASAPCHLRPTLVPCVLDRAR